MQKPKEKSNIISGTTLDHNISEVRRIIADINKQKNFVNSLPFQISLLKQLLANNQSMAILIAIEMLNLDLLEIFYEIIRKQAEAETPRESLIIKIGEVIADINYIFLKDNTDENLSLLLIKHNLIQKTKQTVSSLSIDLSESTILFLRIYRSHMQFLFTLSIQGIEINNEDAQIFKEKKYNESLQNCFLFLLKSISKCEIVPKLINEIFDMIKIIANLKQFKEILLDSPLPEDYSINDFITKLIRIISTTEISTIVSLGLQILDPILKSSQMKEMIRQANPMSFIFPLMGKFRKDNSIAFYACRVLSQIIEEDDIQSFLDILLFKRFEDLKTNIKFKTERNSNVLKELNDIYSKDEEMFKEMKKNIPRVLLILSRNKAFRLLLNDMCSLECFVDLLESDLELYDKNNESEKELVVDILPDFVKLLLNLLKNYTLDISEKNKFLMKICYCFIRTLDILKDNKLVVYEIFHYFLQLDEDIFLFFLRDINKKTGEMIFINLLSRYYDMKWIFSFLHKCPIVSLYQNPPPPINSGDTNNTEEQQNETKIFNNHCLRIIKLVEELFIIFNEKNKEELLYHIHAMSLQLVLGVTMNQKDNKGNDLLFNEASLDLFCQCIIKLFEYVINPHPKCVEIYNDRNICAVMTLAFSGIENNSFSINKSNTDNNEYEDKSLLLRCDGISKLLDRLSSTKTLTQPILSYLSQRLSKLVEYKLSKVIKIIFVKESLCEFVIRSIEIFLVSPNDIFLKEILTILNQILNQSKEAALISKFISKNGMSSLMKVVEYGSTNSDLTNSLSVNLNLISSKILIDANVMYESQQLFKNMAGSLKEIKFSKGLNAKVYTSLIQFFINIIKSCDLYDSVDELNLLTHLANEYNDIYSFHYEDISTNNHSSITTVSLRDCKPIQAIVDLIAICLQNCKSSLTETLECKLFQINLAILNYINSNDCDIKKNFDSKIFESIVLIIAAFIKYPQRAKESYNNPLAKKQFIIINQMIKTQMGNIDELSKIYTYFETMINYENNNIEALSCNRIITIEYIQEINQLFAQKTIANTGPLHEMIMKCIELLNNPELSRNKKNINAENERILKELSLITNERKSGRQSNYVSYGEEGMFRRPTLSTVTTQRLKLYYDKIMPNFNLLLKKIPKNALNHQDVEVENNNLSDLLQMLKYFTKDDENVHKLIANDIVTKLIMIVESENIFSLSCQENGYKLFNILSDNEIFLPAMISNKQLFQFILREIMKITKYYSDCDVDLFLSLKIKSVTLIASQLSNDKDFIMENQVKISLENISKILMVIPSEEKEIMINLITIIQNIIKFNWDHSLSTPELTNQKNNLGEMLLKDLWSRAENMNDVLLVIIKVIDANSLDEEFIDILTGLGLLENLCQILIVGKEKKSSSGFIEVLSLMNKLSIYSNFAEQLTNIGLLPIYNSANENTFNKQILELSLVLFITLLHKDKKYISNLWLSGINDFCIKILSKYYNTCHQNIIKLTLELVVCLIDDQSNIKLFAINGFDTILKTLNSNIKNREIVLFSFIIINAITGLDINANTEKLNRKNSIIVGNQTNSGNKSYNKSNTIESDDNPSYQLKQPQSARSIVSSGISFNMENEGVEQKIGSYDFSSLLKINIEVLDLYKEDYDIEQKLCQLMINIVTISSEPSLKILCLQVIINNIELFLSSDKIVYIQLLFDTINKMITCSKNDLKGELSCIIMTFKKVIRKVIPNISIAIIILQLIYRYLKLNKKMNSANSKDISSLLTWFANTKDFEKTEKMIYKFNKIITIFANIDNSIIKKCMTFVIKEIKNKQLNAKQQIIFFDNMNSYCKFYDVKDEENAKEFAETLILFFRHNRTEKNGKSLLFILKIITTLSFQSLVMKEEFGEDKTNFITELQEFIKEQVDDTMLICQANTCEMQLKDKGGNACKDTDSYSKRNMTVIATNDYKDEFTSENPDVAIFLKKQKEVKYYNEKGEIQKVMLSMDNLKDIIVTSLDKKTKTFKRIDSMNVSQMETCVRSCSTQVFKNSKGFFKKPKAKNCFSIMGVKEFNKPQKTFDIECNDEKDCITYVDYITMVIKKYNQSSGK